MVGTANSYAPSGYYNNNNTSGTSMGNFVTNYGANTADPFFSSNGGFGKNSSTGFPEDVPSFRDFFPTQPLKSSPIADSSDDFTK